MQSATPPAPAMASGGGAALPGPRAADLAGVAAIGGGVGRDRPASVEGPGRIVVGIGIDWIERVNPAVPYNHFERSRGHLPKDLELLLCQAVRKHSLARLIG